jgi:CRP-like cAMP-binding protein
MRSEAREHGEIRPVGDELTDVTDMDQSKHHHAQAPHSSARTPNVAATFSGLADLSPRRPAQARAPRRAPQVNKLFDIRSRGAKSLKFPKARDVVVNGGHSNCVYFNHDGWLARYKILHRGSRQIVDFILPGQIFGIPACLFQHAPYSVLTITETTVSAIPFDIVDHVFERDPALANALFRSVVQEAAILGEHLIDTGRRSAYERVSHLLLELLVRLNRTPAGGDMTLSIPLTQELIADALGLTAVHVNRTLRALREDKLIAMDRGSITIMDFDKLSLLSDFEKSYLGQVCRLEPYATPIR